MNRAYYLGNCLAVIAQTLDKLPPRMHYETWQEIGQIIALEPVTERHARLMQLSEILQARAAASPCTCPSAPVHKVHPRP